MLWRIPNCQTYAVQSHRDFLDPIEASRQNQQWPCPRLIELKAFLLCRYLLVCTYIGLFCTLSKYKRYSRPALILTFKKVEPSIHLVLGCLINALSIKMETANFNPQILFQITSFCTEFQETNAQ